MIRNSERSRRFLRWSEGQFFAEYRDGDIYNNCFLTRS